MVDSATVKELKDQGLMPTALKIIEAIVPDPELKSILGSSAALAAPAIEHFGQLISPRLASPHWGGKWVGWRILAIFLKSNDRG